MTKDETLKLARTALGVQLDALLGKAGHLRNDDRKRYAENGIKAIDEVLAQPEPWEKFCDSNCVWTDHHPDCKLAEQEQHQDWCASLTQMLMSMPPKPAPCNCKPKQCCYGGIAHDCHAGEGCRIAERLKATQPPQRKPLSDEEIRKANHHMVEGAYDYSFKQGVKWAEYKHGIKVEA